MDSRTFSVSVFVETMKSDRVAIRQDLSKVLPKYECLGTRPRPTRGLIRKAESVRSGSLERTRRRRSYGGPSCAASRTLPITAPPPKRPPGVRIGPGAASPSPTDEESKRCYGEISTASSRAASPLLPLTGRKAGNTPIPSPLQNCRPGGAADG